MPRPADPDECAGGSLLDRSENGCAAGTHVDRVRGGLQFDVWRDVSVAPDVAASRLRDTRWWPTWSPTISGVESDDRYVREGTRGRVRVAGAWIPFRVTGFNGRRWTWRVAGLPATGHRVEGYAGDDDRCRVVIEVPLPAAGYVPTCRRALDRFARLVTPCGNAENDGVVGGDGDDEHVESAEGSPDGTDDPDNGRSERSHSS